MPTAESSTVGTMLNLGPKSARWLEGIGITSAAALRRVGAVPAFVRLKHEHPGVSLNLLYALVGAVDGLHWTEVRRTRRLDLLLAVEDRARLHPAIPRLRRDELLALRNIGPAMRRDLALLGISTVAQLARRNPDALYMALARRSGKRQDPCVWDTFAAAIHQARTGEALPWWHYTPERRRRQIQGLFPPGAARRRR
ncbi:MAG TPA: TfoX/Sxy family DNA transformation protein [Burkholderiaceae bacterium]|nr:TfoX/Sxy family DNA transformation protein [Burkholderiaceae bacterium]